MDRVLLHPESPETSALIDKALNYLSISNRAWQDYQGIKREAREQALSDAVSDARRSFLQQAIMPMIEALMKGDHDSANKIAMTVVPPLSVALTKASDALSAYQLESGRSIFDDAQQRFALLRMVGAVLIVLGLVMCAGCALGLQAFDLASSCGHTGSSSAYCARRSDGETRSHVPRRDGRPGEWAQRDAGGAWRDGSAVSQMDQVSQQNAALVEQASAAAMSLEEQAGALRQAVASFRLGEGR